MPNSTCRLLSNGYKFDTDYQGRLEYRPCCLFPTSQAVNAPAEDHVKYRTMLNAIDANTDLRCKACNFLEKNKLRKTWQMLSFEIVPDDVAVGDASYLEVQIDRTCNGGCIICGPWYSSYWASELKQLQTPDTGNQIDTILKFIDIQQVRRITFLGGEPFLSDTDYQLLKLITQPSQVTLQYTTNGSIYPTQERIDQWAQFKSVWINFSIDGVGDRFDYVRYPLKWHTVNANIHKMLEQMPDNVFFKANHTVNIFNLYYHNEFDVWYDSLKNLGRIKDYTFSPANGVLNPFSVTDKLLTLLKDKYDNNSKVLKLVNNSVDNDKTEMIKFTSELDTRRGLNWRTVFPEIADCF